MAPQALSAAEREYLEQQAVAFEKAWQQSAAPPPSIVDFLPDQGPLRTALLIELIRIDRDYRKEAPLPAADYLRRYPELSEADLRGPEPTIPGYEDLQELGRGAMGVVYRARHVRLGRLVALKMLLQFQATGEELARFFREAEVLARLQHPNIVTLFEIGEHQGMPFLTLEYVDGGTLARKIAGSPQPAQESAALVRTLALAMQEAHQAGIVHRDLKPGNVLLTREGTAKITDFGLARFGEAGLTQTGAVLGTPSYMAPEQARGEKEVGPAADVYALGAILYKCLTGRPPFLAATAVGTLAQVIADDPVPPRRLNREVPRDLETICLKCLHKEPQRRYASCRDLSDDLQRFLAGEPIKARPVAAVEWLVTQVRRRPGVAAVVALVATLAGVGLWFFLDHLAQVEKQKVIEAERKKHEHNADLMAEIALEWLGATTATEPRDAAPVPHLKPRRDVRLLIGLSSENRRAVREGFEAYQVLRAAEYRMNNLSFTLEFREFAEYPGARQAFKEVCAGRGEKFAILLIDDPWLPLLADGLVPLDELAKSLLPGRGDALLKPFVGSLDLACRFASGANARIYGLPLVGNVQLLLYRKDLLADEEDLSRGPFDSEGLKTLERVAQQWRKVNPGGPEPFVVRFNSANPDPAGFAEQFWEVYRCFRNDPKYGVEDETTANGKVVLERGPALQALKWLRDIDPRGDGYGHDDDFMRTRLFREGKPMLLGLGWPSWAMQSAQEGADRGTGAKVGARGLSAHPVLGTWLLVVPDDARLSREEREEAFLSVYTLSTSRAFQAYLAQRGCVPTLRTPRDPVRSGAPWLHEMDNYQHVRSALQAAWPRPRTAKWEEVEQALSDWFTRFLRSRGKVPSAPPTVAGLLVVD